MNWKKALFSGIFTITLTSTSLIPAAADNSLKETDQKPTNPIYKKAISTQSNFTESLKSRRMDPSLDKMKQTKRNSKLIGKLKEKHNKASLTDLLSIEASLNFDASEEKFEKKLKDLNLTYKKTKHQTYEMSLNKKQIELLESMDDVMLISSPDDYAETSKDSSDGTAILSLNA